MDANTTSGSQVGIGATGNTLGLYAAGGTPKVVVSATGIDVTGTATMGGLDVDSTTPQIKLNETDVTDENTQIIQASGSVRFRTVNDAGALVAERMRIDHGTGDVSFYEDTGTTAKMVWDASAESLGIGTSSPTANLQIKASSAKFRLTDSGITNTSHNTFNVFAAGQNKFSLGVSSETGTSSDITIDGATNNVGIGTSSPQAKLQVLDLIKVSSADQSAGSIIFGDGSSANYNVGIGRWNGALNAAGSGGLGYHAQGTINGGGHYWYLGDATAGSKTEVMRINSSGNVGIGTISPTSPLHIKSATNVNVRFDDSGSSSYTWYMNDAQNLYIPNVQLASTHTFYANGQRKVDIDSSGNVLVGETSSNPYNGLTTAHVFKGASSTSGAAPFGIYSSTGTANVPVLNLLSRDTSTDTSSRFLQFYANVTSATNTAMGGIVGNGASNVQFASISDVREKTNIESINGSLDKIKALNPVEFDWIASGEHCKAGFVAQEVEEVFPEFVVENMSNEGQEERKGLTGGMTGGIVAHLVKAIQEQQTLIESLTARIAALEE